MAYGDDIDALNCDHRWSFDNTYLDLVGTSPGTGSGWDFPATPLCRDATYAGRSNATTDRVSIPTTTDINNSAQSRKAVGGWFSYSAAQGPPKRIYGEGNQTTAFHFAGFIGNNVMFEVIDSGFDVQIYGFYLEDDRAYHLLGMFSGNGYDNEVKFFIDGVEMTNANPSDRQPDTATLSARGVAEFADPAGTVGIGGGTVLLNAPVNGLYNEWATWDGANAALSDTDIRVELFEKGALADLTISSSDETGMQAQLDLVASTSRSNAPCCIEIEEFSTGDDYELLSNGVYFNELSSIHYRYNGTGSLTIINTSGSNADIISSPWGSASLKTQVDVEIIVKDLSDFSFVSGARVYIEATGSGDVADETVILNELTDASGSVSTTFNYLNGQEITGYVRQGTNSIYYQQGDIAGPISSDGLSETVLLIRDE